MRNPLVPNPEVKSADINEVPTIRWCGQSGRYYALFQEPLENFALKGHDLYVVAEDTKARWIGTASDIIDDHASRTRFRAAIKTATTVLRLPGPNDSRARITAIWDIEGGQIAGKLSLVSAG